MQCVSGGGGGGGGAPKRKLKSCESNRLMQLHHDLMTAST